MFRQVTAPVFECFSGCCERVLSFIMGTDYLIKRTPKLVGVVIGQQTL